MSHHIRISVINIDTFLSAGYKDKDILEIIHAIAIKTISNYTNHITAVPLTKKKLSKQADVAGIDKGSSNPRHELGPVA